jgi:hypothetical protein
MSEVAHQNGKAQPAKKPDRFVLWPLIVVLMVSVLWAVVIGFFPGLLFILVFEFSRPGVLLLLPGMLLFGAGIAATLVAIAAARREAWRRAVSAAVLPVAMVAVALNFSGFSQLCREAGDRLHFYVMRPSYLAQVAATPSLGHPRLLIWNWGGMVFSSKGVVYDESDEIALPAEQQSIEWKTNPGLGELACGGYGFEPMGDHLYLAWFPC